RRPQHCPEGVISLEVDGEPVFTHVNQLDYPQPLAFALNAASEVTVSGDRFVHAWVQNKFSDQPVVNASLNFRARQFSSYIVVLGTVASTTRFLPKYAILVRNKDDVCIPLIL